MDLSINTRNTNTSNQYQKIKNLKSNNDSFANQLSESKRKLSVDDKNTSVPVYSNIGALKNTVNTSKSSTNYSVDEIEKRRAEIHEIQERYDDMRAEVAKIGNIHGWNARVNPEIMEKVLDLQIKNNKDIYYTNGKININKIAEDCGISLKNATPLDLESLRQELNHEGLIDNKTADILESFVSRIEYNTASKTGCSLEDSLDDAYNNIGVDVLKEASYFKYMDFHIDPSSDACKIDDIILDMFKL